MENEQRLVIVQQFILDVLHSPVPSYEAASGVLDYLISEADAFAERTGVLRDLKTHRQDLTVKLVGEGLCLICHFTGY